MIHESVNQSTVAGNEGHVSAQFDLGAMYEQGSHMTPSMLVEDPAAEALKWYKRADVRPPTEHARISLKRPDSLEASQSSIDHATMAISAN